MIYIELTRKTSSSETLFDSDTSGNYLEFNQNEIPQILSGLISKLNLHGEAVVAVYVDNNGNPDMNTHLVAQWTIRVIYAGVIAASATYIRCHVVLRGFSFFMIYASFSSFISQFLAE